MEFDLTELVVSFLVSGVGFVLFSYGKSMKRGPHIGVGLVLLVFPYFVSGPIWIAAVGAALCAGLYAAVRLGW